MINYRMEYLLKVLKYLQDTRNNRAIKIIDKLKKMGIQINYEDVMKISGDGVIGRPHIARSPDQNGYVPTIENAFTKYLAKGHRHMFQNKD